MPTSLTELMPAAQSRNNPLPLAAGLQCPEARELFAALLFALSTDAALAQHYPAGTWQLSAAGRRLDPQWSINYRTPLEFSLSDGAVLYQVRALSAEKP
ncbi:MAG: hypothetical protein Q8R10_11910 [Pseudomonas sp.]|uniref:hypothetical protein n=1 Tax=Pseudomonas sp. TaxID=306 RepID=UPI0027371330|nr:hypothetical protein [Pseudomonas sp.]MDP3847114.1 hypothetical protein [Pseudomonas sp.]